MKKLIKALAIVIAATAMFCTTGCGKGPDAVAIDLMEHMRDGKADNDYLKKVCTEDTAKLLGGLITMGGDEMKKEMEGAKFSVVETKIDGDKAVVKIHTKKGDKEDDEKVNLVKVDGKWKVEMKKDK